MSGRVKSFTSGEHLPYAIVAPGGVTLLKLQPLYERVD
jgi:hypothetical protein